MDISISFPAQDRIRVRSQFLFADPDGRHGRRFMAKVASAPGVVSIALRGQESFFSPSTAIIRYNPGTHSREEVVASIRARLTGEEKAANGRRAARPAGSATTPTGVTIVHEAQTTLPKPASKSGSSSRPSRARNGNGVTTHTNGASPPTAGTKGHASGPLHRNGKAHSASGNGHLTDSIFPPAPPPDDQPHYRWGGPGAARTNGKSRRSILSRLASLRIPSATTAAPGPRVLGSGWQPRHESRGRIRFHHERLARRREVCQAIERELMSVLGIDNYKTSATTGTVLILYNTKELTDLQLVEILDSALAQAESTSGKDKADLHLPLCTLSLPVAATAQFMVPMLLPVAVGIFLYTSIPTFRNARDVLFRERPARRRRPRCHRRRRLRQHVADLSRHTPLLVPGFWPSPRQEDPG